MLGVCISGFRRRAMIQSRSDTVWSRINSNPGPDGNRLSTSILNRLSTQRSTNSVLSDVTLARIMSKISVGSIVKMTLRSQTCG